MHNLSCPLRREHGPCRPYVDSLLLSRSRRGKIGGKISVKCQFAKNIWNFCEKGECGALAMIYFNSLSRLGSPDVLKLLRKSGGHTNMSQAKNKKSLL